MPRTILFIISLIFLMSSCGGEGDSGSSGPLERKTTTISGIIFNGPVSGSTVTVWEFKKGVLGRKLGQTSSDHRGQYQLNVISSGMPILIKADGGAYLDPHTNKIITVSNGKNIQLSSVANLVEGGEQSIMVTPLTHMTAALAQYKIQKGNRAEKAITDAIATVNTMYGFDVNTTKPVNITGGGHSSYATDGHKYGAVLTAYSSYAADLIKTYPLGRAELLYTSIYLSDIQHEDVLADGVLDGLGVDAIGIEKRLSFGRERVTSNTYTWRIAQHTLIAVNNPKINLSGTRADEYRPLADRINQLGTDTGVSSIVAMRALIPLDEKAPTVKRIGNAVLVGKGTINLNLQDDIGVKNLKVSLQYQANENTGLETFPCTTSENENCTLDKSPFVEGMRETGADVLIATQALDKIGITSAKLLVYASDVIGNNDDLTRSMPIDFIWDNIKPVITITSPDAIQAGQINYTLTGSVEDTSDIALVTVKKGDEIQPLECITDPISTQINKCRFTAPYDATLFGDLTSFIITARDSQENEGEAEIRVTKDNTLPTQDIIYNDVMMEFINSNNQGVVYSEVYRKETFTATNIESTKKQLNIDYQFANTGFLSELGDAFSDFTASLETLKSKFIPYLTVIISDPNDNDMGSLAQNLELTVSYFVKPPGASEYTPRYKIKSTGHQADGKSKNQIPHAKIENGTKDVTYYIPYVKELLGERYLSVEEGSAQKLVIQTKDPAGNTSNSKTVYFKTTFNLPVFDVITPFINADVQLEGLNDKGEFDYISSCLTETIDDQLDVAGCSLKVIGAYSFLKIRLSGKAYYYQWSDAPSERHNVDLTEANLGAYFSSHTKKPLIITELSAYHMGLFDFLWGKQADRSASTAENVLKEVNNALAGDNSFFTFDPIATPYATNVEKMNRPDYIDENFLHRFILESLVELSKETTSNTSVDFASAFYQDLLHDGKANGKGPDEQSITVGNQQITADTYRGVLGELLNELLIKYGYSAEIALEKADILAKAYPSLTIENIENPIFDKEGSSIDRRPPDIHVLPNENQAKGSYYNKYIRGKIDFTATMSDPSGIQKSPKPTLTTQWYTDTCEEGNGTNIETGTFWQELPDKKTYDYPFSFNSDRQGSKAFSFSAVSSDNNGNNHTPPYRICFTVDNDVPLVEITYPKDNNENTYYNINKNLAFVFSIKDAVGDLENKRELRFVPREGGKDPVIFRNEKLINREKAFDFMLCLECEGGNTIPDGEWTVYVIAEDKLGNKLNEKTKGLADIIVNIDSSAPIVITNEEGRIFAGNGTWSPMEIIESNSGSPLSKIEIVHKPQIGQEIKLTECGENNKYPACIEDESKQPNILIKLDFRRGNNANIEGKHQFIVQATDSAFPPNTSKKGALNFTLDLDGPVIVPNIPWGRDDKSQNSLVLGKSFTVTLSSITDPSGVKSLGLYHQGADGDVEIKKVNGPIPPGQYTMMISETQAKKIQLTGENTSEIINFILKASDQNGIASSCDLSAIRMDKDGPTLRLIGDIENTFYYTANGGYPFTLAAKDHDGKNMNSISDDGVDKKTIRYCTLEEGGLPCDMRAPDDDEKRTLIFEKTENASIKVITSNVRGVEAEKIFAIKVDNEKPRVSVTAAYLDDTQITDNTVTKSDDVELTFTVSDLSGVKTPTVSYTHDGEPIFLTVSEKTSVLTQVSRWSVTLRTKEEIAEDGDYQLSFVVEDKVKYPKSLSSNPNKTAQPYLLKVRRKGVTLNTVSSPSDFIKNVSPRTLDVTFTHTGDAKLTSLECWIRENVGQEIAPTDFEMPYKKNEKPVQPYGCRLNGIKTMTSGATLITRTTAENEAQEISFHPFAGIDVKGPTVITPPQYNLSDKDVETDANGTLQLTISIEIEDDFTGLVTNTTGEIDKPVLEGNLTLLPSSCAENNKKTTCLFKASYMDLLPPPLGTEQVISISSLEDKAGNKTDPYQMTLVVPKGELQLDILSPVSGSAMNGRPLTVEFRYQAYENSMVKEFIAIVGSERFSSKDTLKFTHGDFCDDQKNWRCSTFTHELPNDVETPNPLAIEIKIVDSWTIEKSASIRVNIDNTLPEVSQVTFEPAYAKPGQNVSISATFNEVVTKPKGIFQGSSSAVEWTGQSDASQTGTMWQGTVRVPEVLDTTYLLIFSLSDYRDQAGNTGIKNEEERLAITPVITIDKIEMVNPSQVNNVLVTGSSLRFKGNKSLRLIFTDEEKKTVLLPPVYISSTGKWQAKANLSSLKNGLITLTVNGTNEHSATADQKSKTFTLPLQILLNSINPTYPLEIKNNL